MIDVAILRAMAAAGATVDVIIAAVEMAIKPEVERRKRDAERKRRKRVPGCPRISENVTGQSADTERPLQEERKKESKKEERERPARKRARSPKVSLPENWTPRPEDFEPSDAPQLARMRDWALAKAAVQADWAAFWRNWKRRAPEFNGRNNGNGRGGSVLEAGKRIDAQLKAMGATDDYIPGSSGPKPLQLDQPLCPNGPRLISSR